MSSRSVESYLLGLIPQALTLAVQAIIAIYRGDHSTAARKAEEAARRQAVKVAADAAIRAKKGRKKDG